MRIRVRKGNNKCLTAATSATRQRGPVSRSMNFGNGVSLMARRCAAMCFRMAGCADRSPGLRSYRRALGFICIVPGDAARIARKRSTGRSGDFLRTGHPNASITQLIAGCLRFFTSAVQIAAWCPAQPCPAIARRHRRMVPRCHLGYCR